MTNTNPYEKAHGLADAIKESDAFRRYAAAQKKLSQNPEALAQVKEFRGRQMEADHAHMLGQSSDEDKVGDLALQYAKLNKNEVIAEYFEAEAAFVQLYNDIQEIIQDSLDQGFGG